MPARVGTANTLPNLVKRSASGLNFNGTNGVAHVPRASSISTENATLVGSLRLNDDKKIDITALSGEPDE